MLKKKLLALVIAALSTVFVFGAMSIYTQSMLKTTSVCIAAQPIKPGTKIRAEMIAQTKIPVKYLQPGAIKDPQAIVGKYVAPEFGVQKNDFFYPAKLTDTPFGAKIYEMAPNQRAVGIETNLARSVAGMLIPGSKVDLVRVIEEKMGGMFGGPGVRTTGEKLENIEVKDLRDQAAKEVAPNATDKTVVKTQAELAKASDVNTKKVPAVLVVAVTPEQAQTIIDWQETGRIWVTLHPVELTKEGGR